MLHIFRLSAIRQFGRKSGLGPYNPQRCQGCARINTEHIIKNLNLLSKNGQDTKAVQEITKHIGYLKENLFSFKNERKRLDSALIQSGIKFNVFDLGPSSSTTGTVKYDQGAFINDVTQAGSGRVHTNEGLCEIEI